MRMSHETIHQALFLQARGELRTQLKLALRSGRAQRVPCGRPVRSRPRVAGMVNISERPAEAQYRAVPIRWEGDLIIEKSGGNAGVQNSARDAGEGANGSVSCTDRLRPPRQRRTPYPTRDHRQLSALGCQCVSGPGSFFLIDEQKRKVKLSGHGPWLKQEQQ